MKYLRIVESEQDMDIILEALEQYAEDHDARATVATAENNPGLAQRLTMQANAIMQLRQSFKHEGRVFLSTDELNRITEDSFVRGMAKEALSREGKS
jgi:hypothetical protein